LCVAVRLRARHLVGKVLVVALARVKGGRNTVGVLQLRWEGRGIGADSSRGAVDIDEVRRRRRGLLWEITPAGGGVGLKGFAGAEDRVGRG
jgi:hypothetical protein